LKYTHALFAPLASAGQFLVQFFWPTLLGNVVGGTALVAVLNYGQVVPEVEGSD
jgi:formate/nitrite transporter FocA (FNT family)